ncbi:hypothetical protein [Nafulsella turpanensis]|uniref:hypothetical protein n=1 Tax=Nafulsella turpanensis TaxID=1265690 RepID=UPI000344B81F|nr:hypothetical protein [Nafulsella turpanensis]
MKKLLFPQLMLMLVASVFFVSCSDESEDPAPEVLTPKMDGVYVFGSNTIADDALDPDARMSLAVLDPTQGAMVESMEGIYGKFMYIGANSTIQFAEVEDEVGTTFGAADGGSVGIGAEVGNYPINDEVIYGTLETEAAPIEVSEEGLYYAYIDTNTDQFVLMRVEPNIIGDATEGQWATGTPLPQVFLSKDSAVYEASIPLTGASGYRYRFNDGWAVYQDPNIVTLSSLGVESYGEAWDSGVSDIGFYTENIPHHEDGIYTVRLTYNAATGEWDEDKVKTGNLEVDYSAIEMGLFGNAYVTAPEDTANWEAGVDGYELHTPVVDGNTFTWSWDAVDLIQDREFIFLENGEWGGLQIDYTGATVQGAAIENGQIVDATTVGGEYHNFFVAEGGPYNITLVIDGETDARTINIVPAN